ncbi:MAG: hypothetical protein HFH59_11395 [Lachnospiraceae bacterium]|nr:hypothetical protein [Lachnospiraceae bacterium]MCI9099869.1 hypothetical protein [Lachnospiraceae bacterium]MCI9358123.1 hypothetical protein [Lachnospiraceae bacterium]
MLNAIKKRMRRARRRTGKRSARPRRRQKRILQLAMVSALLAIIGLGVYVYESNKTYSSYKVLNTSEREESVSTQYLEVEGNLFTYSKEGASLQDVKGNVFWTVPYEMQSPIVDACDSTIVAADQGGTTMVLFNREGEMGSAQTERNIVKVCVAKQGVVAVILDDGSDTWINFYDSKGNLIAENQARIDEPGYPLDIAVSEDGQLIMVTYQFIDGAEIASYVAFYNFGTAGQGRIDNIVSGYQYNGVVIPQTVYLNSSTAVAFRDDGFSIYKGKQIPKESANITVDKEIISTFYDTENIGMVFENEGKDQLYTMQVYDTKGREKFQTEFNIPYSNIRMSEGAIVMNNDSQVCVMGTDGSQKFKGSIAEGNIEDFFKIGRNKYVLALEHTVAVIKLK